MKKITIALAILLGLSLTACNKKTPETTTSDIVAPISSAVESTEARPNTPIEVEIGNTGEYSYTVTFTALDNTTYIYKGSTNQATLMDLCREMQEFSSEFRFETDGPTFTSIHEQVPDTGYYAVYVNGKYVNDINMVNDITLISEDNYTVEIKQTTDNVFYKHSDFRIPTIEDVYSVTILDYDDTEKLIKYKFENTDRLHYTYTVSNYIGETSINADDMITMEEYETIRQTVLGLDDILIYGNTIPEQNGKRYMIIINEYVCVSNSQKITDLLNSIDHPNVT